MRGTEMCKLLKFPVIVFLKPAPNVARPPHPWRFAPIRGGGMPAGEETATGARHREKRRLLKFPVILTLFTGPETSEQEDIEPFITLPNRL